MADIDTSDYHSEQLQQATCSREKQMRFRDLPDVFGIADDILVVKNDSNGAANDKTLCRILKICRK